MSKNKKQKDCYRSMDNSRKPICKRNENSQFILCQQAEVRYNTTRQEILQIRKMKNRQSAQLPINRINSTMDDNTLDAVEGACIPAVPATSFDPK